MESKIIERYYTVTLTKVFQRCKTKQFLKRSVKIKITGNIKIIRCIWLLGFLTV